MNNRTSWYYPNDCVYAMTQTSTAATTAIFAEIFNQQYLQKGDQRGDCKNGTMHLQQIYQQGNMSI
jgi:hypothetical protein